MDLDLALTMGDAVRIDGYGLNGRLSGSLRVLQPAGGAMRGTGVLEQLFVGPHAPTGLTGLMDPVS